MITDEKELETLAAKFGAIPKEFTNHDALVPAYLTQEEFDSIKLCKRTGEVTSRTKWPQVGGRDLYPMSGLLTDEEYRLYKKFYNEYKDNHTPGSGSRRSSTPAETEEEKKAREERWMKLLDHVVDAKDSVGITMLLQMPEFPASCKDALMIRLLSSGALN